jgi:thiamine biosynthesis lipoprotein ApbE
MRELKLRGLYRYDAWDGPTTSLAQERGMRRRARRVEPARVSVSIVSQLLRIGWLVLGAACCITAYSTAAGAEEFAFYHENVLGTSLELAVAAENAEAAGRAEARVLSEIDRLSAIYSSYDDQSEFRRWQRAAAGTPIRISRDLFEVLAACDRWTEWSGRAFDPRVESLTQLWARCAELGRAPANTELHDARTAMSRLAWQLDPVDQTAKRRSDVPLSLNGIAKGHIVERACAAAVDPGRGVRGALLNVGGDLCSRGKMNPTIGIAAPWADSESSEPLAYLTIAERSVASSGRSQRGFSIQGRWYSHIFDPRTGRPVEHVSSATVVAPRGIDADVLAKVFNVLSPAESIRLANSLDGVACLIVTRQGAVVTSDGWHKHAQNPPLGAALAANPSQPGLAGQDGEKARRPDGAARSWPAGLELVVNYEINRPDGVSGRYRRPYLAVWIEDKNGFPVRTLALWVSFGGAGPFQWLPDLKRWYKSDRDRKLVEKKEIIFTVSRPTRQPGKYSVIWDGKDNSGRQLDRGDYTVWIEAAREHGTYQSIRKQVSLADMPFSEELKGNVEIKSASIAYRRKDPAK